jgi:hypothetical protein
MKVKIFRKIKILKIKFFQCQNFSTFWKIEKFQKENIFQKIRNFLRSNILKKVKIFKKKSKNFQNLKFSVKNFPKKVKKFKIQKFFKMKSKISKKSQNFLIVYGTLSSLAPFSNGSLQQLLLNSTIPRWYSSI